MNGGTPRKRETTIIPTAGEDVFAAARIDDVGADEMVQVFERIKAMP